MEWVANVVGGALGLLGLWGMWVGLERARGCLNILVFLVVGLFLLDFGGGILASGTVFARPSVWPF